MGLTKLLFDQLQSKNLDLASATDLVVSTMDQLKEMRSNDMWDHTFKYISDVATLHGIEAEDDRQPRKEQRRSA